MRRVGSDGRVWLRTRDWLIGLYQLGIECCIDENEREVCLVLDRLVAAIHSGYGDGADGVRRLYDYCRNEVLAGHYKAVSLVLQTLQDTLTMDADEDDVAV